MTRAGLTEKILDIKREKGWSWKYICQEIGGTSPVLLVGALLGQMKLTKPQAANAADLFGLSKAEAALLNEVPMRGAGVAMPPTDPLIYRFYELVMVNGPAWKALIEEEFGDGIMSAIDFDLHVEIDGRHDAVAEFLLDQRLPRRPVHHHEFVEAVDQRIGRRHRHAGAAHGHLVEQRRLRLRQAEQVSGVGGLRLGELHLAQQRAHQQHRRSAAGLFVDMFPAPSLLALDVENFFREIGTCHGSSPALGRIVSPR